MLEHTQSRLNEYIKYFKRYSYHYNVPWTLLAAMSYQESKWSPNAKSHKGALGLMQVTQSTAQFLGFSNLWNPEDNIKAGAFYIRYLYEKTPKKLNTKDRWLMALAAYNMGWGHLQDGRSLARVLKKNPNTWSSLRLVLPKLSDQTYYSRLSLGFANGFETTQFVENVYAYYQILNNSFNVQNYSLN